MWFPVDGRFIITNAGIASCVIMLKTLIDTKEKQRVSEKYTTFSSCKALLPFNVVNIFAFDLQLFNNMSVLSFCIPVFSAVGDPVFICCMVCIQHSLAIYVAAECRFLYTESIDYAYFTSNNILVHKYIKFL